LRARHSVENQWDLLRPLGVAAPPSPADFPVEMPPDPTAVRAVAERLERAGVTDADRIIVIHVSAGNPFRRWPADSFVQLAASLASTPSHRVIVTAGPSERDAAARTVAGARAALGAAAAHVVDCGEFSLSELRALVDRAAVYIGGDSGPLHVAATSRVPIVALYGPTLPARSRPWRPPGSASEAVETVGLPCRPCDQRACAPGDFRCLTRITPREVVAAVERALAASSG
jgi:ADP-heptose:LPS heptosyltransferase